MERKAVSGMMLMLLLIGMLTLAFNVRLVEAGTITVPDDYPTIQEAINAANPGDTVIVMEGMYPEGQINVTKPLTIMADGVVIVDGIQQGRVFYVTANKVTINGFIIRNSSPHWSYAGIELNKVQNCIITKNTMTNNSFGIWLHYSSYNTLLGNTITDNEGSGVIIGFASNNNVISGNTITDNDGHGLDVSHSSSNNVISGNTITDNRYMGVQLAEWCNNNIISYNTITNHWMGSNLIRSSDNVISANTITNNDIGIRLFNCTDNMVYSNNITDHWFGIHLWDSSGNIVYHNNFINNIRQVYDASRDHLIPPSINTWDDGYPSGGNYWSDYTGVDLKRGPNQDKPGNDGIGDTLYIIDEFNCDRYPLMSPWTPTPPRKKKIEVKIVAPKKGEIFFITPTPRMPIINCRAQVVGIDPDPTGISEFFWEAHLSYTWKHRGESRSQSFTFKERAIGGSWIPDFGSAIMGGNMEINVAVTISGMQYRDSVSVEIRGENPDKETVKAELGELKYQILAYLESKPKWHHFDKKGLPIFGPPSGYGLMQLDPPPSYREIWDWKANIKAGKEHFNKDIEAARGYAAYVRGYHGGKEPVTDLSEEQILRQTYYSYNAGRAYWKKGKWWPYYVWDMKKDMWVKNKKASPKGKKYADTAMEYLNDILQGKPPKNW